MSSGKLGQWAKRLTGLSWIGASWKPTPSQRDVAIGLLTFLEDRRVLYTPGYAETPGYCVESVLEIRRALTRALQELGNKGEFAEQVRAMRIACRHFLDRMHLKGEADYSSMSSHGHWQSWEFLDALGQLRGVMGIHIVQIASKFDLPVHEGLRSILPAEATEADLNG